MIKLSEGPSFLGTLVLVFLSMAVLFAVDTFLAGADRAESVAGAARLYREGEDLMQHGRHAEAIGRFQDALSMERGNRDYQRALAEAQLAAGKSADAESTLSDLLQSDPTDGSASLLMSRVIVKQRRYAEAISYLHRAIYGEWKNDPAGNRLRARFELIDLLAKRNSKEELLSELMAVQDQLPPELERKRGRLFLQAGSPNRAAEVFHAILNDDPENADALTGLGEAEFARGDYRAAQHDFQSGLRAAPDDQEARQHLELVNQVLDLDPTIRGLGPSERFRRSRRLMAMTAEAVRNCAGQNVLPELQELLGQADSAGKERVKPAQESENAESYLGLAEQLWETRKKICKTEPDSNGPLALVLARIAQ
ncbi:MAG TPA: tetratricopeptide repeat protein [Bryobacteraceae bacterium]|nr:tetratricopeptide repeat protein [Bryobacteraceae bacterium]